MIGSRTEREITLGFSPCPNDTFIFYALAQGKVEIPGVALKTLIRDVEELNSLVVQGNLDVSKISFHNLGYILDSYVLLDVGAALGKGCGPLLVTVPGRDLPDIRQVLVPGIHTTATLLLRIFYPHIEDLVVMRYDEIMPAVASGKGEAGLIIHEGRFTYSSYGLVALADLGELWEKETGLPIPLGGIVAKRSLGLKSIKAIQKAISKSLEYSQGHFQEAWPFIEEHAQEMEREVIKKHISLYVNEYTASLGREGRETVTRLLELARERSILPPSPYSPFLDAGGG